MSSITVTWEKMGSEFTYEVQYAKNSVGPWIRAHDTRLTDASIEANGIYTASNSYTIRNLNSNTAYYIRVMCVDKHHQQWYNYTSDGSVEQAQGVLKPIVAPSGNTSIGFTIQTTNNHSFGHGPFGHYPFG